MKRSPDMQKLDRMLHSLKLVAGGLMGDDPRAVEEIIEADAAEVVRLGRTAKEIATRMRELTEIGRKGLGTAVRVDDKLEVSVSDSRGQLPCPWPHAGFYFKTATTARRIETGKTAMWSDLNIHLIEAHSFFEGRGSPFRIEPAALVKIIF